MTDCEKCKYYHNNCDARLRCRIDVEQIRADAIDEFAELIESAFLHSKFDITDVRPMAEQLKEKE